MKLDTRNGFKILQLYFNIRSIVWLRSMYFNNTIQQLQIIEAPELKLLETLADSTLYE